MHLGEWETVDLIFVLFYFVFSVLPYKSLVAVFGGTYESLQLMACDKIKALSSWWFDWTVLSYSRTPGGMSFLRKIVKQKLEKHNLGMIFESINSTNLVGILPEKMERNKTHYSSH